ncbi:MAG: hypothetical protein K1Y36_07080 [Blastocatellia bacterium]|nr:hypothetical protein [Blastocatellia bacterium]
MSSYFDKFSEWGKKAKEKAKEIDEKYNVSEKVEQTVKSAERVAEDVIQKGSEVAKEATQTVTDRLPDSVTSVLDDAKEEIKKADERHNISETIKQTAEDAAKKSAGYIRTGVGRASEKAGEAAEKAAEAAEKASRAYNSAKETAKEVYGKAEDAYDFGTRAARATASTFQGAKNTKQWIEENPGKAALIGLAAVAGIRLGSAFPGLDKIIFGTSRHWLFHSSLISIGSKKLTEKFVEYLHDQETQLAEGKLSQAEAERLKFQRDVTKYVGAPLVATFNIALGATLISEIFTPGRIVGFPLSIILGGNPLLEGMWLFGNGLVCISNGYELIMVALKDQEDVQRIVREIKGLLPEHASPETESSQTAA